MQPLNSEGWKPLQIADQEKRKLMKKSFNEFLLDLAEYALNWVESVASVMVDHAKELYEDEAVVYMLDQWNKLQKQSKESKIRMFKLCFDHKGEKTSDLIGWDEPLEQRAYYQTLYEVCYKRFTKKEER